MGVVIWLGTAVGGAVVAIFLGLIKDEVSAWLPEVTAKIITAAARNVPEAQRQDRAEEWRAHVADTTGKLSQLGVALSIYAGSLKMREYTSGFVQKRLRVSLAIMAAWPVVDWLSIKFQPENWWLIHASGLAHFYYAAAFAWAAFWVIHLKPYVVGEHRPRPPNKD